MIRGGSARRRVVVTGMGVVSPIGVGLAAFESGLRSGRSGGRLIRNFDAATFPNQVAAEVDDAVLAAERGRLDPASVSWLMTDRKAYMAAIAADMAITDAGLQVEEGGPASATAYVRGISFGPGIDYVDFGRSLSAVPDPAGVLAIHDSFWRVRGADGQPTRMPFDGPAVWAARRFGFLGPRVNNIGACAAGAMAIGEGARWIRHGRVELVLAAGFDSMISPLGVMGFSILGALTAGHQDPSRASRPFDVNRDGFVPGEGAGVLVLEELSHARARGARIYGEIAGYGASLDAYRPTAPEPGGRGATLAMQHALIDAGWEPSRVGYVNAHGTSTPLNDVTETRAIKAALGERAYQIPISSTKSQIGHLVAGAGAVELIASLVAMKGGFIPPTINLETPDPECDLDYVPRHSRVQRFENFLSNSFGFGGQNACLAVQRYDEGARA